MSLYLHCYVFWAYKDPPPNPYLTALRLLVTAAGKLDFQTRLQVCRFLGSRSHHASARPERLRGRGVRAGVGDCRPSR
ncbi:MAG: hypothetical protein KatS3mg112_0610 [Thermogutta sp.]|nr:MAG: hypothetical protein KatS3mg112_0610 [Thermogutta sp.]